MARVGVNGTELEVRDEGRGPEIVLLPGLGAGLELWDAVAPLLGAHRRVIRLDLRGFGRSAAPPSPPYSLGLWARDVKALLDVLKVGRAFFVGHGLGAAVALELGLDFPMATRGIVAVAPLVQISPLLAPWYRQQLDAAERQGMAAVAALVAARVAPSRPELAERYAQMLQATAAGSYARAVRAAMQADLGERAADLAKPTLVVAGQHDPLLPVQGARELEEHISGARLAVLPGVGHLVPWEAPQELAQRIGEFAASAERF